MRKPMAFHMFWILAMATLLAGCGVRAHEKTSAIHLSSHQANSHPSSSASKNTELASRSIGSENIDTEAQKALASLSANQIREAARNRQSLVPELTRLLPQVSRTTWINRLVTIPFAGPDSLPMVLYSVVDKSSTHQELLTYTSHGVMVQNTASLVSAPFAIDEPPSSLVMGSIGGQSAFVVLRGSEDNIVTLALFNGRAWHTAWSQAVTTTDIVTLNSVSTFTAGNTPAVVYHLVKSPHLAYVPLPPSSKYSYWIIFPKEPELGQTMTISGWIYPDAGKTAILNWTGANGEQTQWTVPVQANGYFSLNKVIPRTLADSPALIGNYTLSTVLERQGDSMELLQGDVLVR